MPALTKAHQDPRLIFETRSITPVAKAAGRHVYRVVGSTPTVDREGDVVDPRGCITTGYLNGGPGAVLYAHEQDDLPIGRANNVTVTPTGVEFDIEFLPAEIYPFAGQIEWCYANKFLKSWSVTFLPLEYQRNQHGGMDVSKWDLLEISSTPVPCNVNALLKAAGRNVRPVFDPARAPRREERLKGIDAAAVKNWRSVWSAERTITLIARSKSMDPKVLSGCVAEIEKALGAMTPKDGKLDEAAYMAALETLKTQVATMKGGAPGAAPPGDPEKKPEAPPAGGTPPPADKPDPAAGGTPPPPDKPKPEDEQRKAMLTLATSMDALTKQLQGRSKSEGLYDTEEDTLADKLAEVDVDAVVQKALASRSGGGK